MQTSLIDLKNVDMQVDIYDLVPKSTNKDQFTQIEKPKTFAAKVMVDCQVGTD